jgi:GntR family transcriptional regulator, N-acetylglucosamine utilization regulator
VGERRGGAITLYEKTIDFVRKYIADHGLGPGDRLPSENEVAAMAGVSLMTVRRAMSELVAAGTLQRVQGRGTFVRSNRVHTDSTIIGGLKRTLALQGVELATTLVSLGEKTADPAYAERLSIPVGTSIWEIVRLRRFNDEPAVREVAVIPRILAPDLDRVFTPKTDSLYEVLSSSYGLTESQEEQTLVARPATSAEASDLELHAGSFVIEITGTSISSNGTAFDSFEMVFVPHMFAFRLRSAPTADPVDVVANS